MSVAFNGGPSGPRLASMVTSFFIARQRPMHIVGRVRRLAADGDRSQRRHSLGMASGTWHDRFVDGSGLDSRLGAALWRADGLEQGLNRQLDVTSVQNSKVKLMRSFHKRRTREEQGKVLVEGHRLVCDLIEGGLSPELVLVSPEALTAAPGRRLQAALEALSADVVAVSTQEIVQRCCDTVTAQGVVALVAKPMTPLPDTLQTILVCDGIQDPGNLGTLVRTAAGLGADAVVVTGTCVDYWGPKTLRSSMGAAFRLPSLRLETWDEVVELMTAHGVQMYAAEGSAMLSYIDADWTVPSALVVGAEAEGLGSDTRRGLEGGQVVGVRIPLVADVESLNAAVAGAIVLGEAQRQRAVAQQGLGAGSREGGMVATSDSGESTSAP